MLVYAGDGAEPVPAERAITIRYDAHGAVPPRCYLLAAAMLLPVLLLAVLTPLPCPARMLLCHASGISAPAGTTANHALYREKLGAV